MKRFTASIQTRPPLCYWPLLITLAVILCASGSRAAPSTPASSMTPRAKLDRILACQQTEKDVALAEKQKTQDTIAAVESFIGSLSDQPKHYAAHERANRALTLAREALAKIDERLQLADRKIGMTVRALQYLAPAQSGVHEGSLLADVPRQYKDWLADGENESRYLDGLFGEEYGFVTDPALLQRMTALVNRLQMLSSRPDVPIQVRVLTTESGMGASATATAIYFDKAYLDLKPSESELLFVAGHELAHVQLGHFSEAIIGRDRDTQRLRKDLGPGGTAILGLRTQEVLLKMRTGPWEQRQEEAADLLGAQQALEAGASPKGIQEAMLRMDEDEKTWAKKVSPDIQRYRDSLRDHANPLDRLKALETTLGSKFWERTDLTFGALCPHP
mgnify:CR=1 FL=1